MLTRVVRLSVVAVVLAAGCAHGKARGPGEDGVCKNTVGLVRVEKQAPVVPLDADTQAAAERTHARKVETIFRVCVAPSGQVASVDAVLASGFPSYDAAAKDQLKQLAYCPFDGLMKRCENITLETDFAGAPEPAPTHTSPKRPVKRP